MTTTELAEPTIVNRPTVLKKAMLSQMTVSNSERRGDLILQPLLGFNWICHTVGGAPRWEQWGHLRRTHEQVNKAVWTMTMNAAS